LLLALGLSACSPATDETAESASSATAPTGNFDFESWDQYLGGADSSQYSSLAQIDKSNVGQLEVAWTYATGENYLFNPLIVGDTMYVLAKGRSIVALDAATGRERWTHANEGAVGTRGMNFWRSPDGSEQRLLYINAGHLTALDAKTGETIRTFGVDGRVDLRVGLDGDTSTIRALQTNNPGRIFEDLIIMSLPAGGAGYASSPADIHAYNVRTGVLQWIFHTVPRPGEFGADTWPEKGLGNYGGVHNWSESTVDAERGNNYVPTGTARTCSATACSRSTRAAVNASGTFRRSITISGTTICRPRRSCSMSYTTACRSRPLLNRASKVSFTFSTALPAHRYGPSKSDPCRNRTRPAK
jgi:glucose dehydrogenase